MNKVANLKLGLKQNLFTKDEILNLLSEGKITYDEYVGVIGYEIKTITTTDDDGNEVTTTEQVPPTVDLDILKNNRLLRLKIECANAIYRGFSSQVTGETLFYGFDEKDQSNYNQQATMYILNPDLNEIKWNTKTCGEYIGKVVTLTKEQFMQLISESANHKQSNFQKYWAKVEQINTATTPEEISAIVWEGFEGDIDENATI